MDHFEEVVDFLAKYSWLFNFKVTDFFVDKVWKDSPPQWLESFESWTYKDLAGVPFGELQEKWPDSLKDFVSTCLKFSLPRELNHSNKEQSSNTLTDINPDIRRGMSEKKAHEVCHMAPLIHDVANESGAHGVVDVGSGLGYLGQVLHTKLHHKVLGLEGKQSHTTGAEKRAVQQNANTCPLLQNRTCELHEDSESETEFKIVLSGWLHNLPPEDAQICSCKTGSQHNKKASNNKHDKNKEDHHELFDCGNSRIRRLTEFNEETSTEISTNLEGSDKVVNVKSGTKTQLTSVSKHRYDSLTSTLNQLVKDKELTGENSSEFIQNMGGSDTPGAIPKSYSVSHQQSKNLTSTTNQLVTGENSTESNTVENGRFVSLNNGTKAQSHTVIKHCGMLENSVSGYRINTHVTEETLNVVNVDKLGSIKTGTNNIGCECANGIGMIEESSIELIPNTVEHGGFLSVKRDAISQSHTVLQEKSDILTSPSTCTECVTDKGIIEESSTELIPKVGDQDKCDNTNFETVSKSVTDKQKKALDLQPVCMVGLHCCGDLTPTMMKYFTKMEFIKSLCVVSCCYHRMEFDEVKQTHTNFPLSAKLHRCLSSVQYQYPAFHFTPYSLRLAAQETRARWRQQTVEDHSYHTRNVAYRGVVEMCLTGGQFVLKKTSRRIVHKKECQSFETYLMTVCRHIQIPDSESEEDHLGLFRERMRKLYKEYQPFFVYIEPLTALQFLLQPVLESLILLDRNCWLKEQGFNGTITPVFDEILSPRNLALIAIKE